MFELEPRNGKHEVWGVRDHHFSSPGVSTSYLDNLCLESPPRISTISGIAVEYRPMKDLTRFFVGTDYTSLTIHAQKST